MSASCERGGWGRWRVPRTALGAVVLGAALASGGCSHSLFDRGVQRSQFETYDTMRNRHASDTYEDEFGRERINLRGRLIRQE